MGVDVFRFEANLPEPASIDEGERYWLSIANDTRDSPDGV